MLSECKEAGDRYVYRDAKFKKQACTPAASARSEKKAAVEARLTVGLRYTEEERDWTGCTYDAGVAYLDTEIKEWVTPLPTGSLDPVPGDVIGGEVKDAAGEGLPQSPEWSCTVTAHYEWPIGNNLMMEIGGANAGTFVPSTVANMSRLSARILSDLKPYGCENDGKWGYVEFSRRGEGFHCHCLQL